MGYVWLTAYGWGGFLFIGVFLLVEREAKIVLSPPHIGFLSLVCVIPIAGGLGCSYMYLLLAYFCFSFQRLLFVPAAKCTSFRVSWDLRSHTLTDFSSVRSYSRMHNLYRVAI